LATTPAAAQSSAALLRVDVLPSISAPTDNSSHTTASAKDFNMSKTCPLSTAVEFKAWALLDVFHTVVGKRTPG